MTRIAYVSGRYVPHAHAVTHIEDRGYQFADGIYEYTAFYNRRFLDLDLHLARLERSLAKLSIPQPMSRHALTIVLEELVEQNGRDDGAVYLQITRGIARRDHPFPDGVSPVLTMTVCGPKTPKPQEIEQGARVIVQPDIRWDRCDIKSLALLANVLAKQQAAKAKAREAWLVLPDGTVTEGSVSNAYIVTDEGIVTHPADEYILGGVTRDVALRIARENGIRVAERPFNIVEAKKAKEAFLTSTSANVLPVTEIDGVKIGGGKPGETTRKLMALYNGHVQAETGKSFA